MVYRAIGTAFVIVDVEGADPGEAILNYRRARNAWQRLGIPGGPEVLLSSDSHEVKLFDHRGNLVHVDFVPGRRLSTREAELSAARRPAGLTPCRAP